MARQRPVPTIRKSGEAPARTRTAADIRREQAAARERYQGPSQLPGGIGFNGDLVQTPNGPVWVPHGSADPANATPMLAGDTGRVSDLGQPQDNPNTNLYQYREGARNTTYDPPPPIPDPWGWGADPFPADPTRPRDPVPVVGGYNGMSPPANNPFTGGMGPQPPGATQPPPSGMGPPAPGGAPPGPPPGATGAGPGAPGGPNNPFDPDVGPPAPGTDPPPNQPRPDQLQGLLAAYGYTTGPNGELLPIHLRQGMSPFQNQPGQQQHQPYTLPGFGENTAQPSQASGQKIGVNTQGGMQAQGGVPPSFLDFYNNQAGTPPNLDGHSPSYQAPGTYTPGAPYMGGQPPMMGGRRPGHSPVQSGTGGPQFMHLQGFDANGQPIYGLAPGKPYSGPATPFNVGSTTSGIPYPRG